MTYTLSQRKAAYSKLPGEVKNFIMDELTVDVIERNLTEIMSDESKSASANGEILNALCGLQSLDEAISNISRISGKNLSELITLKDNLHNNIFAKIDLLKSTNVKIDPAFSKKRVAEIVGKYGLSTSQATILENEVMSVIDRNLEEKITALDLVNLLNISNLLAEQVAFELESRVFERGVKLPEKPQTSRYVVAETKQQPATESRPVLPETKPETFGGTLNIPKEMMPSTLQNTALDKQKPSDGTSIGVPRYATEDIYNKQAQVSTAPANGNIINSKLNTVTPTIKPIETKYQKDPYREPLE
jgi:hypothetical protein